MAFVICGSMLLIVRLGYLQISEYKRYQTLSFKNQMNIIPITPPRGVVLDRRGVVLAENIPVYVLEIIPERVHDIEKTLQRLQILLPSIGSEDIHNYYRQRKQQRSFIPIPVKLKLSAEEVATFATHQYQFPGVNIKARLMRYYPYGELTAHALGFVGRINLEELQKVSPVQYRGTHFIGKSGIEKYYETRLHGQVGYQQVETDVSGRTVRVLRKQNAISGETLYLTLDLRLQKAAYEALSGQKGAVVAIDTHNGDILAMVSTPSFNPNLFVNGITKDVYQALTTSKDRPLYNRAVRGLYPPASTVKPFIALAGLDKNIVDTNYSVYDPGWFKLPKGAHLYRDWKKGGHGITNVQRAIMVSCDTYFYQLGYRLGIHSLSEMLSQFGFGHLTHVDIEELPGLLPNPHWKQQTKGQPWYPGDTLITSIGQGFMLASPLQLANATVAISQYGKRYRPHLLQKTISDTGEVKPYQPLEEYPITLKEEKNWDIVTKAMHSVITNLEGTGYRFGRNAPYSVAIKTGTAQVFSLPQQESKRAKKIPDFLKDHSLLIAFAPVENPSIAIATVVENEVLASQVSRKVLDTYFSYTPFPQKEKAT